MCSNCIKIHTFLPWLGHNFSGQESFGGKWLCTAGCKMSFHNHRQLAFLHRWIQNTYFLWGGRIPLNYRQTYCVASALLNHYLQMVRPQALQNICKNQNGISRFNQIKDNFSSRCSVYDLFLLLSLPWCSVPPITLLFFWAAERFRWGWLSLSSPVCPLPGLPYPCPSPAWSSNWHSPSYHPFIKYL